MKFFKEFPESNIDEDCDQDVGVFGCGLFEVFHATGPQCENRQQTLNSYSGPDKTWNLDDPDELSFQNMISSLPGDEIITNDILEGQDTLGIDDNLFFSDYHLSFTLPEENRNQVVLPASPTPYVSQNDRARSQPEIRSFSALLEKNFESDNNYDLHCQRKDNTFCYRAQERPLSNDDEVSDLILLNSSTEHRDTNQEFTKSFDDQPFSSFLATPPNLKYQTPVSDYKPFTPISPPYTDEIFPSSSSWWGHDMSGLPSSPQYSPYFLSENFTPEIPTLIPSKNQTQTQPKYTCYDEDDSESDIKVCRNFSATKIPVVTTTTAAESKRKKIRHYSSVADISTTSKRGKQFNRQKTGQHCRSVSPCLQIRKRKSAKAHLRAEISSCNGADSSSKIVRSVGRGHSGDMTATNFVNYTPNDSQRILMGVAPSGSNKTKARREKEAFEKRQKLSQAALRAVQAVGGDVGSLVKEEFFVPD